MLEVGEDWAKLDAGNGSRIDLVGRIFYLRGAVISGVLLSLGIPTSGWNIPNVAKTLIEIIYYVILVVYIRRSRARSRNRS